MSDIDHTSDKPLFKTCKNGENCVHPNGPTLPIDEFYFRHDSGFRENYCKSCRKKAIYRHTATFGTKKKSQPGNDGEAIVIQELRQQGIYAVPGKCSEWHWVDVVAWGCVRIDVKTANESPDGSFLFGLTSNRYRNLQDTDVFVLVCHWQNGKDTFHVFPSNDPVFKNASGQIKKGIAYIPLRKHRWKGEHLSPEKMMKSQDAWHLIEEYRLSFISRI